MKKVIALSLAVSLGLTGKEVKLEDISVVTEVSSQQIKDVSGEELKSADLAEALAKQSASVALVRRSGISNDVLIRGFKKDNINVTIDGAKAYGAGPNRMDPPISHVLTNNIDYIELTEGPYNVEDFGVLGADVKIHTKQPTKKFSGEVSANLGSFGYKKGAFSLSGGNDDVTFLLSASKEQGGQYKDGDGNTFAGQQDAFIATHPKSKGLAYLPQKREMNALSKNTLLGKVFWNITDTQRLKLSYTRNRSDNILYPNTPMDAIAVDDDIYNVEYSVRDLGAYSKVLSVNAYYSDIYHPMSNAYRKKSKMMTMAHKLTDLSKGIKIKNALTLANHDLEFGLDGSSRVWDGGFYKNNHPFPAAKFHSIWDATTKNIAFFMKDSIKLSAWQVDMGLRYDKTTVSTGRKGVKDNHYNGLSANIFATYDASQYSKYFVGIGHSSRVPDGKELYFHNPKGKEIGNANLNKVVNTEIDAGTQWKWNDNVIKAKLFYSNLQDYIVYNATSKRYTNVDANIWGAEISGSYMATDALYFDYGLAYQRGKKKHALVGQTDRDLAEISPLKLNLGVAYNYDDTLTLNASLVASAAWDHFDGDNGEQALDAYQVVNLKMSKMLFDTVELTLGVDNLFDTTYALSNTYKDQTLIAGGGVDDVMLMNEPGRYIYANIKYSF